MKKNDQWNLSYLAIAFIVMGLMQVFFVERQAVQPLPYSQFMQLLNEQKVSDLQIDKDRISGKLVEPSTDATVSPRCGSIRRWRPNSPNRASALPGSTKTPL